MSSVSLHVAFIYTTRICPPGEQDPRDFKSGLCVGAYSSMEKAQESVALYAKHHHAEHFDASRWFMLPNVAPVTQFFGVDSQPLHNTYSGYVTTVHFERRGKERRS